ALLVLVVYFFTSTCDALSFPTRRSSDLGGAAVFAETVNQVRKRNPGTTVEILPSDMKWDYESLNLLMSSKPDIFNHNVETVRRLDRKSTRLNSSHVSISYAVFCLKKRNR